MKCNRKTSTDYRKELNKLIDDLEALENRIFQRGIEICKNNPGIVIFDSYPYTTDGFIQHIENFGKPKTKTVLDVIEKIENENRKKENVIQNKLFTD